MGFGNDVIDYGFEVFSPVVNLNLPVGAGAVGEDLLHVVHLGAGAEFIHHVINEFEQLVDEVAGGDLLLFAEIDHLALDAVAGGAPAVLVDQAGAVGAETEVVAVELVELGDDGLHDRGEADGFVHSHRDVAHAELQRVEERVEADVPPDLLRVVDAPGLDEQVDVAVELLDGLEQVGDAGARKTLEDLQAVGGEAGVAADPERRVGGQREDVRQEIARGVLELDGGLAVGHADVDVQAEDEVGAGDLLEIVQHALVALAGGDLLVNPVGKRVRAGGGDAEAGLFRQAGQVAAEAGDGAARAGDVVADLGADLDDRLVQLGPDALLEEDLAALDDLLDVGFQLARDRVDDLELLLDAEGELGLFAGGHGVIIRGRRTENGGWKKGTCPQTSS